MWRGVSSCLRTSSSSSSFRSITKRNVLLSITRTLPSRGFAFPSIRTPSVFRATSLLWNNQQQHQQQQQSSSSFLRNRHHQFRSFASPPDDDDDEGEELTVEKVREYLKKRLSKEDFEAWEEQQAMSEEQKSENERNNVEILQYLGLIDQAILKAKDDLAERVQKAKDHILYLQYLYDKRPEVHPNSNLNDPRPIPNHDPRNAISFDQDWDIDFRKEDINDAKYRPLRIELGLENPSRDSFNDIYAPRLVKTSRTRTFAVAQSSEEQREIEEKSFQVMQEMPPIEHFFPPDVPKDTDPKTIPAWEPMPPYWPVVKYWKSQKPSEESLRAYAKHEGLTFEKMKELSDLGLVDIELMKLALGDAFKPEKVEPPEEQLTETENLSDHLNKVLYHGLKKVDEYTSVSFEWSLEEWYDYKKYMLGVAQNAEKLARADQNFRIAKLFRKPVVFDRDFDYDAGKPAYNQRPPGWEEPKVRKFSIKEEKPTREIEDLAVRLHECNLDVERNPQDAVVFLRRGVLLYDLGKCKESIPDFDRAIQLNHWNPEITMHARYFRGLALDESGSFEDALKAFSEVIEKHPNFQDAFVARGCLLFEQFDDEKRAIADLTVAISINPQVALPFLHRARFYYKKDQFKLALADVEDFISFLPRSPEGYLLRGNIYDKMKEYGKAIQDFTIVIEVDQNRMDFGVVGPDMESWPYRGLYNRAAMYAKKGELQNAMRDVSAALQKAPTFEPAIKLQKKLLEYVTPEK